MLKTVFGASLVALSLLAAPAAFAADAVLALDTARFFAQSAAGKSIQTQLQAIGKSVDAELEPEAKGLQAELASIQALGKGLTMEQANARPDIRTKMESLNKRRVAFERKGQKRQQELLATENKATEDFQTAIQPVLKQIIAERGGLVVVNSREVVFVDPKIDITQDAITKMDAAVKTIAVTKVNLPDKPAAPKS